MTIVEKIRALLAKAASTDSQHEAEAFLRKAHELMERYQLQASDLEIDDPIHKTAAATANGGASPDWDFQLMFAVAKYFGCKGIQYWHQKKLDGTFVKSGQYVMWIVGRESARITAVEMHKYLVKTVRRLGRENATPNCKADTMARRIGRALQIRISEMCPSEPVADTPAGANALITLNGTLAKFRELFPDSKPMGGTILTSANAEKIASGIGLNLQTSHNATLALR